MSSTGKVDDWAQIKPLVLEALDRPATERHALLDSICGGDGAVRARVEQFVRAFERGERALEPRGGLIADPLIGQRIARYTIVRLLGYGGMGAVYQAKQDQPSRIVALKLMRAGIVSRDAQRRFEFESQILGRLHHPGIAQVYEAGVHQAEGIGSGGLPFFAMEYVEGGIPITVYVERNKLTTRRRLELMASVCDAVHHGHQQGVIHLDLKPANILVDAAGLPKIIDFGVARATDSEGSLTTLNSGVGQLMGTLQYMSPEQFESTPVEGLASVPVDARADIYALGVVLYEVLAGRAPYNFSGVTVAEAARKIHDEMPASLSSVSKILRGDVETIVRTAMEKDKTRRYQSANELAADIRHYLGNEPISAHPPSTAYQLRVFARRNKGLVAGVAASFLILVLGIVAVSAALTRSVRMEHQAIAERDRARKIVAFLKSTLVSAHPMLTATPDSPLNVYEDPFADVFAGQVWIAGPGESANRSPAELMAHAARLLDVSFESEPEIKAEVADTLGVTLWKLGRGEEGFPLIREALDVRRRMLGEDHIDTLNSYLHLGTVIAGRGSTPEGEPLLRAAVNGFTKLLGESNPETLRASLILANNFFQQGRFEESRALVRRNLTLAEETFGVDHPIALAQLKSLAEFMRATDLQQALGLTQRCVDGLSRAFGEDSIPAADAKASLTTVLRLQGSFAVAEQTIRAALTTYRKHYGPDLLGVPDQERELFEILRRQRRFSEAVEAVRDNLDRARQGFGPDHNLVLRLEDRLGRALLEEDVHIDEAERLSRNASESALRVWGLENVLTILYCDTHAAALRRLGEVRQAESEIHKLIAVGTNEPVCVLALHRNLGECLIDQKRFEEAQQALRTANEGAKSQTDPYEPRVVDLWRSWVRLHESQGKPSEAEPYRMKLALVDAAAYR